MIKNKTLTAMLTKLALDKYSDLTERETEVVQHIWEGYANKEIAELLKLAGKTVEAHRHNVMIKYHTGNVMQMIRIALAKGIIKVKE